MYDRGMSIDPHQLEVARDLLQFIEASPTPYHAVREVVARLVQQGFVAFDEAQPWQVAPGARGYVVRGGSVIAFALGTRTPAETGFVLVGAHTDSPGLRVKPYPDLERSGARQVSVEVYGSPILATWTDRDLGLAGRLLLADGSNALVRVAQPEWHIPNLAIHLNREVNKTGLLLDAQQHLAPVWGLRHDDARPLIERMLAAIDGGNAKAPSPPASDVIGFDLAFYDLTPPTLGGEQREFLFAARLDNLASCHAALAALFASGDSERSRVVVLYDHEEVGSRSFAGAQSRFLDAVLERLTMGFPGSDHETLPRALARSLLVSADMAHAVHPNHADKHDAQHRPQLALGPVVKVNANQSYATDGASAAAFVAACRRANIVPQFFNCRNDIPCGSTIGPITAARLGVRTVDVGTPMLSMHSCREMAATSDVDTMIRALTSVFVTG